MMDEAIKCFLLEPTDKASVHLRRHVSSDEEAPSCPLYNPKKTVDREWSYHSNMTEAILTVLETWDVSERVWCSVGVPLLDEIREDPRWPTSCACGLIFSDDVAKQVFTQHVYRRADTGEEMPLRGAPAGALWYADWLPDGSWRGPDGRVLMCMTPDGEWNIDSRASNCGSPDDNEHRCWVRHGTPPAITVDKDGLTCNAGAGSIGKPNWHGFLRKGELVR